MIVIDSYTAAATSHARPPATASVVRAVRRQFQYWPTSSSASSRKARAKAHTNPRATHTGIEATK